MVAGLPFPLKKINREISG